VRSGVVVVDVDSPGGEASLEVLERELGALPQTLQAATGGGGLHLVYEYPGEHLGNSVGRLPGFEPPLPRVDLRADGGSIVVAPSVHVSGRTYRWLNDRPPAPAPGWLREPPRPAPVPIPGGITGARGQHGLRPGSFAT